MLTKEFAAKRAMLDQMVRDKDKYMAGFRGKARALTGELEVHLAEKKMQAKIESLSPAEKQAMLAGLQAEEG